MATALSPLQELADAAGASESLRIHSELELDGSKILVMQMQGRPGRTRWIGWMSWFVKDGRKNDFQPNIGVSGPDDGLRKVAAKFPQARLRPDSVKVSVTKGSATGARLTPVAIQAWHEALNQPIPSLDDLKKAKKDAQAARKAAGDELAALLATGEDGVTAFNKRPAKARHDARLAKAKLAGVTLDGVKFGGADLEEADLSGASLVGAEFGGRSEYGRLPRATLVGADLTDAKLDGCRAAEANFSQARMSGVTARYAAFRKANLRGADLSRAVLIGANFRGADLTGARLDEAILKHAEFDDDTTWPKGFKIPADLDWKGDGPDPRLAPTAKEKARPKPTDFAGFVQRLGSAADPAKLDKAMKMLKADRFRLFARVGPDGVTGVVKSQSDPDLVYSCRLGADGKFSCCTQNLNVCGGLRGSPCKHILVLVVGLTQAGEIDPATAHDWTQGSRGRKPELDRDAVAETLLQYKGAEAGEVDWRPTETIPEDFY